ncbi:MAG TPA: hypothetical protein VGI81_19865 [Tepidisphaeraceae bacterium]|jgi:hypothetical protein
MLRRAIGQLVFDALLDGEPRQRLEQKLRGAGATPGEMVLAMRRYDSALSSVVSEGRK